MKSRIDIFCTVVYKINIVCCVSRRLICDNAIFIWVVCKIPELTLFKTLDFGIKDKK